MAVAEDSNVTLNPAALGTTSRVMDNVITAALIASAPASVTDRAWMLLDRGLVKMPSA